LVVPKSSEFDVRETNEPLLAQLAGLKPKGGQQGRLIGSDLSRETLSELLEVDTFADTLRWAIRFLDVWAWVVVIASCVLFLDVFNRRVAVDPKPMTRWVGRQWRRLVGGEAKPELTSRIERLKAKKQTVEAEREDAGRRFQYDETLPISPQSVVDSVQEARKAVRNTVVETPSLQTEEKSEGYTQRLLAAKRKAQNQQEKKEE